MTLFTIDAQKCKKDGICAAVCPLRLISMGDGTALPVPTADAAELCIKCGHCVAVCPHGAFTHSQLATADFIPLAKGAILSPEQAEVFLRSRRSIRAYREQGVEPEKLTRLIHIARYAPTGSNSQQIQWRVVNSRAQVKKLAGMVVDMMRQMVKDNHPLVERYNLAARIADWEKGGDFISRGAPALVITTAPTAYGLAGVDCAAALSYLDLAAPSLGLGCCWAGFFMLAVAQWPPLLEALALPEGYGCYGMMMVGYPKFKYQRLPPRKEADIVWLD
ncbi:MAG: 4Fe-4S binding protein [Desulfobulbaceae bacterium]|nr:4Fe-4S binding protein [Desulfobulbaceae bacterium]